MVYAGREKQMKNSKQIGYLIAFLVIVCLLGAAQYLQNYKGVIPCPLCILQRFTLAILGVFFLFGVVCTKNSVGRIIIGILTILFSGLGVFLAGRQVWLQYSANGMETNCDVSLQYLLKALPLDQVVSKVFQGSSGCSQIGWEFMGVTLAQWSLGFFILFLLFSLWQLVRRA